MASINSMMIRLGFVLLLATCAPQIRAQDTLPAFNVVLRSGNKVLVSWTNAYGKKIRQLSIQRSADSQRLFKTIMTIPDPTVLQNGYLDSRSPDTSQFYRLYILLDSGRYVFSKSQKAKTSVPARAVEKKEYVVIKNDKNPEVSPLPEKKDPPKITEVPVVVKPIHYYTVKRADTIKGRIPDAELRKFRDSISYRTKDTLLVSHPDTLYIRPFVPRDVFRPSPYIFTDRRGLLNIQLPQAGRKKYRVSFFEADKSPLFEIREVAEKVLIMEKSNFMHAGWYLFELYEDGVLLEKNRFYISKDF
ncbi:hypothetical protein [Flavihumibacter sp. ZG627]|uniref:hypothetical protein n=1 Tax=Flavihumibacter sp. ZG627 TaxID=1463156 RepID=UPI00057C478C|nr:hypothetical protein [Flavihumibacter sp. ZG627]KIC91564.1 hypothetical protein HY58_04810 [Flavihumibacter sp. ZG627]